MWGCVGVGVWVWVWVWVWMGRSRTLDHELAGGVPACLEEPLNGLHVCHVRDTLRGRRELTLHQGAAAH